MNTFKKYFKNRAELCALVDGYFKQLEGEHDIDKKDAKQGEEAPVKRKDADRNTDTATMATLILHLGINSKDEFDALEKSGRYSAILKRARLQIAAAYEKGLLQPSPTGAMFALKHLGWNEKTDAEKIIPNVAATFTVKFIETGPKPASSEKDVMLD